MSKPSLALIPTAYKAGKLYSVLPADGSGDFTVSRNGTGTYLGQDGFIKTALANVPRFEYNFDGTFKGVLIEPAATNFITSSDDFTNSGWLKTQANVINSTILSPNNTLTVSKLIPSININQHWIENFFSDNTANCTGTIYVKLDGSNVNKVTLYPGVGGTFIHFNLETLTSVREINTISASIENVGNGWFRLVGTWSSNSNINRLRVYTSSGSLGASNNAGDGTSGIFIWGAQLQLGTVATSYIPTLDSQVTRPADVMTVIVPTNATQVSYILNGNVVNQSVIAGSTFTLPNGHITQLTMN
jgi:hypothetical protein